MIVKVEEKLIKFKCSLENAVESKKYSYFYFLNLLVFLF